MSLNTKMPDSNEPHEISLKDLIFKIINVWKYILSKWRKITPFVIVGFILGFWYAYSKKPIYTATTTFVLEDAGRNSGGLLSQYSGLASMAGLDGGNSDGLFQGDNILQLYTSRAMIEKALLSEISHAGTHVLLIERYVAINQLRKNWETKSALKNFQFNLQNNISHERVQDSIINKIVEDINKSYLTVSKPDKKLNIIKVEVNSPDESFSKEFNDQIVKTVNDFYIQTKTKKSLENIFILQHQTDSVKAAMNGSIVQSVQINDATPNLNPTRQILRAPVQRSQFNVEASKAILTQLIQNLELAKISLRKETPLIQIIDQPVYPLNKTRMSRSISSLVGGIILGSAVIFCLLIIKFFKNLMA